MNREKVINNIKKVIKKHLDNGYTYDSLVCFELDVIDWNSILEYIDKLQEENKQLKERVAYLEKSNNRREETILEQRQEISNLEDNWNRLKENLRTNIKYWREQEQERIKLGFMKLGGEANSKIIFKKILDEMQELEGSDSNGKD